MIYSTPSSHIITTMSPVFLSWHDHLLHECRTFKANLYSQAQTLKYERGSVRNGDVSRAIVRLSLQTDRIIDIGLGMIAGAPDNKVTRRYPSYWRCDSGTSKFEKVFRRLERDLDQLALALKKDPSPAKCDDLVECLEEMVKNIAFDFDI